MSTLYEYYHPEDTGDNYYFGNHPTEASKRILSPFRPSGYCIPSEIYLKISDVGIIYVDIYALDGNYQLTGDSLGNGSVEVSTESLLEVIIPISSSTSLQVGNLYGIKVRVTSSCNILCAPVGGYGWGYLHYCNTITPSESYLPTEPRIQAWFEVWGDAGDLPEPITKDSPLNGAVFAEGDSVVLRWTDGGGTEPATSYRWYLYSDGGTSSGLVSAPITEKNVTWNVNNELAAGYRNFQWKIKARNVNGYQEDIEGKWSFVVGPAKARDPIPTDAKTWVSPRLKKLEWSHS